MKNLLDNPSIMTIDEVADFLKLSKITIYKLVKKGEIPGFRVGNSWRFQRDKIEFMASNPASQEK
jgi:excisionase family DNA binding protein